MGPQMPEKNLIFFVDFSLICQQLETIKTEIEQCLLKKTEGIKVSSSGLIYAFFLSWF